jgi:zinc protease
MRKILLIGIVSLIAFNGFANKPDTKKIFPFSYTKIVLDNGLKVFFIPFDSPGLVSYYSIVRTGSRDEWEEGKSGFAHFFEHMMFRGTEKVPGKMYDSIITSIGADANAFTSDDQTVFHLSLASEDLEKVIQLESDRFQHLKYTLQQFQTESGAVYGEYRKGRTSPWSVGFEEMHNLAFDKHTYKHTTIGFERDIKNMPNMYDYSVSFYNRYYRPSNVVILVVGDFNKAKTETWIRKYYSGWKPGYVEPKIEQEPKQLAPRSKTVEYEGKTLPLIILGYKMDAFNPRNKNYLSMVHFADLAFGETSALYKKLVLDEQKVQVLEANPGANRDPYMFEIYVLVKDEKDIDYVLSEIKKAVDVYRGKPIEAAQLNELKKRNKYSFLMSLDNPDAIAGVLAGYIALAGDVEVVNEYYKGLDAIVPADIQTAVQNYFIPSNENLIILKGKK